MWGTNGAGVPAWTSANTALITQDITTPNPAITIANGVGQTIGAANVSIDVANNSALSAGLVAAGGANPNQVWGTSGAGVPAWIPANSTITGQNVTGTNPVTITNGAGQVIGAAAMDVSVANNALNQTGVVVGPTAGNANQVWGTNGAGVPAWIPSNSTITGQNVTGTGPITVTNGAGQVIGAAAMNVSVATNALNQTGVVVGPTAGNANQVWGTNGAGVPAWIPSNSTITAQNVTGTGPITVTNGAGQVIGAAAMNVSVATNALNQTGVVVGPTAGNANQVWGTNASGIPAWIPSNSTITAQNVTGTGPITVTNGAGQVIGAAAMNIAVATNALNQTGVVPGPTVGNANQVWGTNGAGVPSWMNATSTVLVDNGLYYNGVAGRIRQGGALVENTTITGSTFNYTHDLTSTGDFIVTEASNGTPSLFVKGNDGVATDAFVGIGTNAPANRLHVNHNATTIAGTQGSYPFSVGFSGGATDYTVGSNATFGFQQTWNNKPLLINSQGNFVGVNLTTAPIQNLDVNGRMNVANGVIQRGPTQINATNDLGLYSQIAGNWIRIASNAAAIKFFTDQGGGNSAGTNATMAIDNANGGAVTISAETGGTGNAGAAAASAAVDINSVTKGILFPRMTVAQRNAIVGPTQGLHIYNTTNNCLNFWNVPSAGCGAAGYWDSYCCPVVNICISSSGNCLDVYAMAGSIALPRCINITINAGVTIGGCVGGGGCGAGAALNCSGFPSGTQITIINNGVIKGKGGNGGNGSRESDGVCAGDIGPNGGQCGGDAILGGAGILMVIINNGTVAGGGGGGGGGAFGCCSAGGGGGGGAGIPGGVGGAGQCWSCVSGFVCGCNRNGCSGGGGNGSAVGGAAGGGNGNTGAGTGCPGTCTSAGGTNGATGGGLGANGGVAGAGAGATGASFRLNGCAAGSGMAGGTIQGPII